MVARILPLRSLSTVTAVCNPFSCFLLAGSWLSSLFPSLRSDSLLMSTCVTLIFIFQQTAKVSSDKDAALNDPSNASNTTSHGISPAVLGGSIAAVAVGLFALFAALIFFLRKRGPSLLVSKRYLNRYASELQRTAAADEKIHQSEEMLAETRAQLPGEADTHRSETSAGETNTLVPAESHGRHQLP